MPSLISRLMEVVCRSAPSDPIHSCMVHQRSMCNTPAVDTGTAWKPNLTFCPTQELVQLAPVLLAPTPSSILGFPIKNIIGNHRKHASPATEPARTSRAAQTDAPSAVCIRPCSSDAFSKDLELADTVARSMVTRGIPYETSVHTCEELAVSYRCLCHSTRTYPQTLDPLVARGSGDRGHTSEHASDESVRGAAISTAQRCLPRTSPLPTTL